MKKKEKYTLKCNTIYKGKDNLFYCTLRSTSITEAIIRIADDVQSAFIFSAPGEKKTI